VVLRSTQITPALVDSIRQTSHNMSHDQVLFGMRTMDEIVSSSLAERRFAMILLTVFAALALILASIGLYGVISYLVGQRTQEIGVRMALGAKSGDILRLILQGAGRVTAIGIVAGLMMSFAVTRLMSKLLYGVRATDPLTLIAVTALLSLVALAAGYIPARRATRIDPMVALREE
jgi:putative ABC transport system permease protein